MASLVPPLSATLRPTRLFSANTFLSVTTPPKSATNPMSLFERVVDSTVTLVKKDPLSMPMRNCSTLQFLMIVLLPNTRIPELPMSAPGPMIE